MTRVPCDGVPGKRVGLTKIPVVVLGRVGDSENMDNISLLTMRVFVELHKMDTFNNKL